MKKVLFRVIYTLILVVVVGFLFQNSISETIETKIAKQIEIKINELRANGFDVTYSKTVRQVSDKILEVGAFGEIEIVDYSKALQYIIKDQKYFEQIFKNDDIISHDMYKNFFEGMTFNFSLSIDPIGSSLDLDLYLVKFSDKIMRNLLSNIVNQLENKEFHIHIDENYNFEVKDIHIINSVKQISLNLIGMSGKIGKKYPLESFKIKELSVDDEKSLLNFQELYIDENLFELSRLKFNTKTDYEDITFKLQDWESVLFQEIKNGLLYSNVKTNFASISLMEKNTSTTFDLDKASFEFILDKFPIQKYEELIYTISKQDYTNKLKEFLKEVSKDPSQIKIGINLERLNSFKEDWSFKEVDLKSNIIFSKNLANMKFYNIYDILQTFTLDLNVDKQSAKNVEKMMGLDGSSTTLIDSKDEEFKTLKVELKEDGVFVNDTLTLPNMMLQIPKIELE